MSIEHVYDTQMCVFVWGGGGGLASFDRFPTSRPVFLFIQWTLCLEQGDNVCMCVWFGGGGGDVHT